MAKLKFYFGAMNSAKTLNLLAVCHNYEVLKKYVVILTPSIDTRSDVNEVASRVGLTHRAVGISPSDSVVTALSKAGNDVSCVLVDEAQFLTEKQVDDLVVVVDELKIPVIAYGLKTSFQGKLFPGSKALLECADEIHEIVTICPFCDRKATCNVRLVDGKKAESGDIVQIGGNESYQAVCRYHFNHYPERREQY